MKITGVRLDGRLGNQLFQYAAAYTLAQKNKGLFFIDQSRYNFSPLKYFKLPSYNSKLNALLSKFYLSFPKLYNEINEADFTFSPQSFLSLYKGFFQNENFWKDYIDVIRSEFQVQPNSLAAFNTKYGETFKGPTIGVHIRRTDIVTLGILQGNPVDATLGLQYYNNCFNNIPNIENYKILFATDDIEFVKEKFGHLPNAIIEQNDEIIDFQILMNANKVIIANSSFSWWAAYLNKNKSKEVFIAADWGKVPYIAPPESEKLLWRNI